MGIFLGHLGDRPCSGVTSEHHSAFAPRSVTSWEVYFTKKSRLFRRDDFACKADYLAGAPLIITTMSRMLVMFREMIPIALNVLQPPSLGQIDN